MSIRRWHWPVAFVIALALHLGLAVLMVLETVDPPAKGKGKGGLDVQLTRSGSRPAESAHTRNDVQEAAKRAATEAAALVRTTRSEKAVLPDRQSSPVRPDLVSDESRPAVPESPVPESADAARPASAPQPVAPSTARRIAADAAATAAPPNPVAASPRPDAAREAETVTARVVDDTQTTEAVAAAPARAATAEETVQARTADFVSAVQAEPVQGESADAPEPDKLPPLEQVGRIDPISADKVQAVAAAQPTVAAASVTAIPLEQAAPQPVEAATAENLPLATATQAEVPDAPAAAPEVPVVAATGAETATRVGNDVTNAGAVGPDEVARALATGRSATVSGRSGDGDGEDRRDALGGAGGDKKRYISLIEFHFDRHLEYPERAREAGLEGVGIVSVIIARDGTILRVKLVQSTGYAVLDEELLAAVERSSPMPPIPETLSNSRMGLLITRTLRPGR